MTAPLYDAVLQLAQDMGAAGLPAGAMTAILSRTVAARPGEDAARAMLAGCLWAEGARDAAIAQMGEVAQRRAEPEARHALAQMLLACGAQAEGEAVLAWLGARMPANANLYAARAGVLLRIVATAADPQALAAARTLGDAAIGARLVRSRHCLLDGDLEAGWAQMAWRLRDPGQPGIGARQPHGPVERPDPADWRGRTVLFHGEAGHGDMIQLLRYVPMARAAGAEVVLEVQPALVRLARSVPGVGAVVGWGEAVPAHDVALPIFHLPWAFRTVLGAIPTPIPYVAADPAEVAAWRARLSGFPGVKVGLAWAGEKRAGTVFEGMDAARSVPLAVLAPLGGVPGVSLVSLQLGEAAAQARPEGMVLHDWTGELHDFAATAALMQALDLVITVDTACVHLAGALGRPVWLLNRQDTCWRWLRERADSPWYPSLRIFRQDAPGEWGAVVEEVRKEVVLF